MSDQLQRKKLAASFDLLVLRVSILMLYKSFTSDIDNLILWLSLSNVNQTFVSWLKAWDLMLLRCAHCYYSHFDHVNFIPFIHVLAFMTLQQDTKHIKGNNNDRHTEKVSRNHTANLERSLSDIVLWHPCLIATLRWYIEMH